MIIIMAASGVVVALAGLFLITGREFYLDLMRVTGVIILLFIIIVCFAVAAVTVTGLLTQ
jgi:hypothetical protein